MLITLGWILTGQAKPGEQAMPYHEGVPTDWSHNHVMFAQPASDEEARELGKDARYWQQLYRRELARRLSSVPGSEVSEHVEQVAHTGASGGLWMEDLGKNATPGAVNYPAKYGFSLTTANCASATQPDYVVYSTGLQGAGTQATIVAYDNLYKGCTGSIPTTYWAYNTGGLLVTSPVISLDGSQIAFVQTTSSLASLVLLKWKASATETVTAPGVPTSVTAATYRTCVAPCMTQIFLSGGGGVEFDDRTSSVFYDYAGDIGWVGGATGWLVKLTGLFNGTPAEVTTGGFPVHVNPSNPNALSSPVYDQRSKNVFVGDVGGFLYRVAGATGGSAVKSGQLDFGTGIVSAPLLDQTNGIVYVFSSSDGTANCTGGTACSAVYALGTSFASGTKGTEATAGQSVVLGSATNPNPLYFGALDSAYYNSVGGTGNMYVCGNTGSLPTLYRIPITSGALGTAVRVSGLSPSGRTPSCSPVTDFPNPNASVSKQELVFFSTANFGLPCGNKGCLMNFVSQPWQPKTAYKLGQEILVQASGALYLETAISNGTSGTSTPSWNVAVGAEAVDGSVTWVNQGSTVVTALPGWTANKNYPNQSRLFDGTNVEIVPNGAGGKSGAGPNPPAWNPIIGGRTTDNQVTWLNAGPWPTAFATLTGGTGGVIIDNTATSAGGGQVYFFTLGNNTCTTSTGSGSCAMQASQSSLN